MEYMSLSHGLEKYPKGTKICQVKRKPKISAPKLTNSVRNIGSCLGFSLLALIWPMFSITSALVSGRY